MRHWLIKSEPEVYSIKDMKRDKSTLWEGVRNYQARNNMQKEMNLGDLAFFYHSNAEPPGVAGIVEVCSEALPDPLAFDKKSEYFDPKSKVDSPTWYAVKFKFKEEFKTLVSLSTIKGRKELANMVLLKNGRLSVQPVGQKEFDLICKLGRE